MATLRAFAIGIDIGQKHDPTAIAVVEQAYRPRGDRLEEHYTCRFLERLPLGTPYPQVATRLKEIARNAEMVVRQDELARGWNDRGHRVDVGFQVYCDATGVGQPVVDLLAESGLGVTPVYFTHGDRRTEEQGRVVLGKAWLVSRLQALFQTRRIALPRDHPEAEALRDELMTYEIKVSPDANDRYGAFRTGTHDDLVTAVGLGTQSMDALERLEFGVALADYYARQM